jgi:hypothetical protein
MAFLDLLRADSLDSLYPSQIIAAVAKSGNATAAEQARTFLSGFAGYELVLPIGPFRDSENFLNECKGSVRGQLYSATAAPVKPFFEILHKLAAIVDGAVGEKEYRPGTKSPRFDNIAQKFVDDHMVAGGLREAEIHANKRLAESANVPASTSIVEASVKKLDTEVGQLNSKQVFAAVHEYVAVVASYLLGIDLIDGVCYVTSFKVDGWLFKRGARPGQLTNESKKGFLAYCVVANVAKSEQLLAYHYQDVVNVVNGTLEAPHAKANKAWKLITFADFQKKCPNTRLAVRAADWPTVYYAVNK